MKHVQERISGHIIHNNRQGVQWQVPHEQSSVRIMLVIDFNANKVLRKEELASAINEKGTK